MSIAHVHCLPSCLTAVECTSPRELSAPSGLLPPRKAFRSGGGAGEQGRRRGTPTAARPSRGQSGEASRRRGVRVRRTGEGPRQPTDECGRRCGLDQEVKFIIRNKACANFEIKYIMLVQYACKFVLNN
ncbi:hypothetical protein R5R35_005845 [Gryllus longicercus]|uniref:Uncharacterized protein n=1 Tax=Gryllus longicercus TaxID=2509291 RepID=A0AAN9VRK8_9ORTH